MIDYSALVTLQVPDGMPPGSRMGPPQTYRQRDDGCCSNPLPHRSPPDTRTSIVLPDPSQFLGHQHVIQHGSLAPGGAGTTSGQVRRNVSTQLRRRTQVGLSVGISALKTRRPELLESTP